MPGPAQFTESVGYALSATLIGLVVAVIALAGNGYLQRRIDSQAAKLDVLLERIILYHANGIAAAPGAGNAAQPSVNVAAMPPPVPVSRAKSTAATTLS
jgi:biopolymer transport protein ExbB